MLPLVIRLRPGRAESMEETFKINLKFDGELVKLLKRGCNIMYVWVITHLLY